MTQLTDTSRSGRTGLSRRHVLVGSAVSTAVWVTPTVELVAQIPACVGSVTASESITVTGISDSIDGWDSNMMVDEVERYTNSSGVTETISPTTVTYESARSGVLMTPFFVRIVGDNSFVVLAVGDAIESTGSGLLSRPFSVATQCFEIEDGWLLGIGFLDANPDGSDSRDSVVRWQNGGNEIWYTGGPSVTESGSVTVGLAPSPGNQVLTHLTRNYILDYEFEVSS